MSVTYANYDFHKRGFSHQSPNFDEADWLRRQEAMGILTEGVRRHRGRLVTHTKAPGHSIHPAGVQRTAQDERRAIVHEVGLRIQSREDQWASQAALRSKGKSSNTTANHTQSRTLVNPEFLWDHGISHVAFNKLPNYTEVRDPVRRQ